jgi:hypothetical protein
MTHRSEPDLLVLHTVRIKGFAEPADVSEATTLAEDTVADLLTTFRDQELVGRRDGRISGFLLTPAGKAHHADLLDQERDTTGCAALVGPAYEAFLAHNETFKQLCTDWQLRTVGGTQVPNDHTDAAYDAAIGERLAAMQPPVAALVDEVAGALARFAPYRDRLDAAVTRFVGGEKAAMSKPLSRSYHDVWMELHEDLLLTLGRERGESDGF